MASSSSSFSGILQRNIQSWIAVLVPSAVSLFFAMVSSGHSVVSISITSLALLISTAIMALKPPKPQAEIKICSSEIKKVAEGEEEEEQKGYSNDPSSSSEDYSDIDSTAQGSDDGSISDDDDDEESLFEICLLPYSGNFVGHEKESSKDCLMEFLTDMNEEDNMIEIDISMGSIKCSGF
ncbi:uncharacterized protein LOC115997414 [Ipomoea triloba]|uniref:uncharacterized protein LOC115997414 n=1 Tax=Ipomoea triloba TaxID=35885 RepID=UPI00125D9E74|nr:uncharacterized protein LOC115997414 [Ipomoea triloba]